jgi:hypothetical protein
MSNQQNTPSKSVTRQESLTRGLAALALVGLGTVLGTMLSSQPNTAHAQVGIVGGGSQGNSEGGQGLLSAADQRKTMIDELRATNSRLERIEALLSKGLTVKVSEMPAAKEAKRAE